MKRKSKADLARIQLAREKGMSLVRRMATLGERTIEERLVLADADIHTL